VSRDREKDKDDALEALLKKASAAAESGPAAGSACPDADVMAAWLDGGLPKELLATVRTHVATCARCQVIAAVMTKLDTAGADAARTRPGRNWLGWLVPVAVAAGAWAIWVFIPRPSPMINQEVSAPATQVAQAPADAFAADPKATASDERKDSGKRAQAELGAAARDNKKLDRVGADQAAKKRDADLARAKPTEPEFRERQVGAAAAANAAAPKAQTTTAAPPPAARPAVTAAAPPVAQARESAGRFEQKLADKNELVSPDPLVRWQVRGAILEKSTDAGKTWRPVKTGVTTALTSGAALSATTCWVVGRAGVVLLTTDGQTWRRLVFPETTDLSAIRATDARTATVTTVEGREYTTSDAGATWFRRLLQEN
jgi:hypothetical protein